MTEGYPDHPWSIRRNGKECARASTRAECDRIIRQLSKIYRDATWDVKYEGKALCHFNEKEGA